jgi:GMP synthase (glutamine-hydrolysing)
LPKKILIIDNTFDPPHGCPEIRKLLEGAADGLGELEITSVRAPEGKIPGSLKEYDGVVLSGSRTRIEETEPWIEAELDAIRKLHALKIPTFGICYGEQMIARALGGKTGQAKQYEYGWVEVELKNNSSPLLEGLPKKFHTFEYHQDEVRELPKNFKLTASSPDCPIQAYDVESAPMWGVQFHPERGPKKADESLNKVAKGGRTVINGDKGDSLFNPKVGETIFRNFLKRVWARR